MLVMGLFDHGVALRKPLLCNAFFNTWFSRAIWRTTSSLNSRLCIRLCIVSSPCLVLSLRHFGEVDFVYCPVLGVQSSSLHVASFSMDGTERTSSCCRARSISQLKRCSVKLKAGPFSVNKTR